MTPVEPKEGILKRFFELEQSKYGKSDFYFKDESMISRILAFYVRPFNDEFMQLYTTVLGFKTYFPERKKKEDEYSLLETEYHENVHKWDRDEEGIWFSIKYLFPQIFAIPFMLGAIIAGGPVCLLSLLGFILILHIALFILELSARRARSEDKSESAPSIFARVLFYILVGPSILTVMILTIIFGQIFSLLWLGFFIFLSPWPFKAKWRRDYELRGFTMTMYALWLRHNKPPWSGYFDWIVDIFAGSGYFYMEPDKNYVRKELEYQFSRFTECQERHAGFLQGWQWMLGGSKRKMKFGDSWDLAEPFRSTARFMLHENVIHSASIIEEIDPAWFEEKRNQFINSGIK